MFFPATISQFGQIEWLEDYLGLLNPDTLLYNVLYGAMITAVTLGAFVWYLDGPIRQAQTIAFMTLAFAHAEAQSRYGLADVTSGKLSWKPP